MKNTLASRRSVLVALVAAVAGASVSLTGLVYAQAKDCPRPPQNDRWNGLRKYQALPYNRH